MMDQFRSRSRGLRRLEQTADGAPQCPTCWAHTMQRQEDGTYRCPSGCPGRIIIVHASAALRRGIDDVFEGTQGELFAFDATA